MSLSHSPSYQPSATPIADRAELALRILGVTTYRTARAILPMWAGYGLLSARDVRRVLARFTTVHTDDFDECADPVPLPGRLFGGAR